MGLAEQFPPYPDEQARTRDADDQIGDPAVSVKAQKAKHGAAHGGSRDSIRDEVLERFSAGEDLRNIARTLGLGFGEVKLIVELYKGEVSL